MGSNTFGRYFRVTTWGESHGPAVGCVIDGCPAGLVISEEEINHALLQRAPGRSTHVSLRKEEDRVQILSGVFEGKTTGTPLSLLIQNKDVDSSPYEATKELLKPGHAQFTYLKKYKTFDFRGGGRASARETACRVAAGAIAEKFLTSFLGIKIISYLKSVHTIVIESIYEEYETLVDSVEKSRIFCPEPEKEEAIIKVIEEARREGDSLGGCVECQVLHVPAGIGSPIYEKIEALLASAMMSIPASKAFEIGEGIRAACMKGSEHNDAFYKDRNEIKTKTNHAGGCLGGITTGMPLLFRTYFKPPSSIRIPQQTVDLAGNTREFSLSENARHDPTVVIRAVPVVRAMSALTIMDAVLASRMYAPLEDNFIPLLSIQSSICTR